MAEQRIDLLRNRVAELEAALRDCKWRLENLLVIFPVGRPERIEIEQDLETARSALSSQDE